MYYCSSSVLPKIVVFIHNYSFKGYIYSDPVIVHLKIYFTPKPIPKDEGKLE